jgi:hypothetical protein
MDLYHRAMAMIQKIPWTTRSKEEKNTRKTSILAIYGYI